MTARYWPVNHICIGPSGVCISIATRRVPPTRTSILATGMVAPAGPYHAAKCSGSVHICQMSSTGASKRRSIFTASWEVVLSAIVFACLSFPLKLREVVVHPVEAGLPDGPVLLRPGRDLFERGGVERTGSVLGALTPSDQPGPFQHLDVLGDGRERQLERLGELLDSSLTPCENGQDRLS